MELRGDSSLVNTSLTPDPPLSLSELLHLVSLCLGRPLHRGDELLLLPHDLLLLHLDELVPLHHLNLDLLTTDVLLLLGCLQLVR